jgi:hypothetical protein
MRLLGGAFLLTMPVAGLAAFALPRARTSPLPPLALTLATAALGLWVAFTADRSARSSLARIRASFVAHGDLALLLRDHLVVYLLVLVRLHVITACGLITAVWGAGPHKATWYMLVAATLMALTWPTRRKTRLLIERAEAERGEDGSRLKVEG